MFIHNVHFAHHMYNGPLLCLVFSSVVFSYLLFSCLIDTIIAVPSKPRQTLSLGETSTRLVSCRVRSCRILSCLVLQCLVLSCLVVYCYAESSLVLSSVIFYCLVFKGPSTLCRASLAQPSALHSQQPGSFLVVPCPVSSCLIYCHVLSSLVLLSYLYLSCPFRVFVV